MNTFTHGPWLIKQLSKKMEFGLYGAGGKIIAYFTKKPSDADCLLIASAPKLLAALQSIVDDHEFCKAHPGWSDRGDAYAETALLAIASATGEQS